MSAAVAVKREVAVEDRMAVLESDMRYGRSDIDEMKGDIKSLGTELHCFRTEVAKEFGNVRTDMPNAIGGLLTEMSNGFGELRTEIGELRTEMPRENERLRADMNHEFGAIRTSIE